MKLKKGNIVVLKNKERFIYLDDGLYSLDTFKLIHSMSNYTSDTLKHISGIDKLNIVEIYMSNISPCELLWQANEVNWDKVSMGTLVRARDFKEDRWKYGKFVTYNDASSFPFSILVDDIDVVDKFRYCEVIEEPPRLENTSNLPIAKLEDIVDVANKHCEFADCTKYQGDCAECIANLLSNKFEIRG